ncbi:MAG: alpha-L-fucosidase [Anaerolineaceae bacterium]|nr:alpha-L-fucosidase [Anaerolineaceae bacterium]
MKSNLLLTMRRKVLILLNFAIAVVSYSQIPGIVWTDWEEGYSKNWEELKAEPIPEWMLDAKLGVYTHWGIYSVCAHGGPDYVKGLYYADESKDKKGVKAYHIKKYGPISEFGYVDFLPLFTAPKFDATKWVQVMKEGGARFGGICLSHHDGFALWDSDYTEWDAMEKGPHRDIYGEIARAMRKAGIKLAATFHMARSYGYMFDGDNYTDEQRKTWDIFDPKYAGFYRNPEVMPVKQFTAEWTSKVREVINKYSPDVIWFDGMANQIKNKIISEDSLINIFKYYYKKGKSSGHPVVVCNKLPSGKVWNFPYGFGLRCYENCRDMEPNPEGYWLADRAVGYPWSWVENKTYSADKQEDYHVRSLIDMVSRGGILFLSLTPKGDGSIPEQEIKIMKGIGNWLKINGEAIYSTRKYKIFGEGPAKEIQWVERRKGFKWDWSELSAKDVQDVRFTRSKDLKTLFAIVLGWPDNGKYTIKTLAKGENICTGGEFLNIEMLGSDDTIKWERTNEGLTVYFPEKKPCDIAYSFKITVKGKLIL